MRVDIMLFGATGFVGSLVAEHLAEHAGATVGLAGRSRSKLRRVRDRLGLAASQWPIAVVDASNDEQVAELARTAGVVASTVGPYARLGEPLVAACARAGTDYVDLTGEVLFVRRMAERYHLVAADSGARIVHSCGFDSVPSDISMLLTAQAVHRAGEGELDWATLVVRSARGGVSGGTVDSLRVQIADMTADPGNRRVVSDLHALSPDRDHEADVHQPDMTAPRFDPDLALWTAPFAMAPYNTRVVRRSNALQGWAYGRNLRYREVVGFPAGAGGAIGAWAVTAAMGGLAAGMSLSPTRALLDRVMPAPGEGPTVQRRQSGHFRVEVRAQTTTGARYLTTFAAKGDPGYAATSVMLGQSALALASQDPGLPDRAGVLTPATGIGAVLADRLLAQDFQIEVRRVR